MTRPAVLSFLSVLAGAALSASVPVRVAHAQTGAANGIHRCVGPDGRLVFTDRGCAESGSSEQAAPAAAGGNVRFAARGCARTREDLLWGVRGALESRDANRFASYYHWAGMGTRDGYRLMDRLAAFSDRPLVDAQLLASADLRNDAPFYPPEPLEQTSAELSLGLPAPEPATPAPVSHAPDLLRVDQMLSAGNAASQVTYFRLQPYAGCWWIRY